MLRMTCSVSRGDVAAHDRAGRGIDGNLTGDE